MKQSNFWPSFFGFLLVLLLLLWAYNPGFIQAALLFMGAWFMMTLYVLFATLAGVPLVLLWLVYRKQQLTQNRPVDGAFPLVTVKTKDGRRLVINPNLMIGPAAVVDPHTGHYSEPEPGAGWDAQAAIRGLVERTNTARAIYPGDQARTNANGAMSQIPRVGALGAFDRPARHPAQLPPPRVVGDEPAPARPIDLAAAWRQNTATCVALGASTQRGHAVGWDLATHPHARIHGATQGSGKTNLAKTALIAMAQQGAHIVVMDRRRFKNFRAFDGRAELIDTSDPAQFVAAVQRLEIIYRERDRILGQHGAPDIDQLPARLVRYVVFISEFGALCSVADGAGLLTDIMAPLDRILREAGATGIHLILEDQIVERGKWPRGLAANAAPFTGTLPLNMGAAGGYHHAHLLAPYHFHHEGQILQTWHIDPIERQLLDAAPAFDPRLAVIDGVARPVADGQRSAATPPPPTTGAPGPNAAPNAAPNDDPAIWADLVAQWFAANPWALTGPAKGISDLARAMAEHQTGSPATYENYKSRAYKLYHEFRGAVRLPGGQPLGVDVSRPPDGGQGGSNGVSGED